MPRPRTRTDDQILDAAQHVLADVGPAQATLARIGRQVSLSPATLLQRFGTRQGLLEALAQRDALRVHRVFDDDEPPLVALRAGLLRLARQTCTPDAAAAHLAALANNLADAQLRPHTALFLTELRGKVAALLHEASLAGEIAPHDSVEAAEGILAAYLGGVLLWSAAPNSRQDAFLGALLDRQLLQLGH